MFKICVIGCGNISNAGHGSSFSKYKKDYDGVCLAGCCDLSAERAAEYRKKFGFDKSYTNYDEMISEIKPDVVSLISPVHLTSSLAIDIMKKGYNIIMEKPPGRNREEID